MYDYDLRQSEDSNRVQSRRLKRKVTVCKLFRLEHRTGKIYIQANTRELYGHKRVCSIHLSYSSMKELLTGLEPATSDEKSKCL